MNALVGLSLGDLAGSGDGDGDALDPRELDFRETFDLATRARFARVALKVICAALEDFEPEEVLKRCRGVHVGPGLLVRKIYFLLMRDWFFVEEMERLFKFQEMQLLRDYGEMRRWAKTYPELGAFIDALADMVVGVPAVLAMRDVGLERAHEGYRAWIEARRKRQALDDETKSACRRVINLENAEAAALLSVRTPIPSVAERTGLGVRAVADLYLALADINSLPHVVARVKELQPSGKPATGHTGEETLDLEEWITNKRQGGPRSIGA